MFAVQSSMVGVNRGMDPAKFPVDSRDYNTFSVWKMSVAEESRGKGIGKKLMSKAEEWARDQTSSMAGGVGAAANSNRKRMRLYTANPIAAAFYLRMGFIVEEKTDHYGIYVKKLDE